MDVLETVPGLGITRNTLGTFEIEARGVKTPFSEKVLFLLDSHPVNNSLINGGGVYTRHEFLIHLWQCELL